MSEQTSSVILICVMGTIISILVVLKVQLRRFLRMHTLHQSWEQEQMQDRHLWEAQQEQHLLDLKTNLTTQLRQLQENWYHWEAKDSSLIATYIQQYEQEIARMNLEYEVLQIPRIEDVPLP